MKFEGSEGGREVGREVGREGGRKGGREGGREGGSCSINRASHVHMCVEDVQY